MILPDGVTIELIAETDSTCEQARLAMGPNGRPMITHSNIIALLKRTESDPDATFLFDRINGYKIDPLVMEQVL